jgi:hypothetical protein
MSNERGEWEEAKRNRWGGGSKACSVVVVLSYVDSEYERGGEVPGDKVESLGKHFPKMFVTESLKVRMFRKAGKKNREAHSSFLFAVQRLCRQVRIHAPRVVSMAGYLQLPVLGLESLNENSSRECKH